MKMHPAFGGLPGILCPCNMLGPNDLKIARLNRPSFFPFSTNKEHVFVRRGASGEAVSLQDRDDELAFHSKHDLSRARNQVHGAVEPIS